MPRANGTSVELRSALQQVHVFFLNFKKQSKTRENEHKIRQEKQKKHRIESVCFEFKPSPICLWGHSFIHLLVDLFWFREVGQGFSCDLVAIHLTVLCNCLVALGALLQRSSCSERVRMQQAFEA